MPEPPVQAESEAGAAPAAGRANGRALITGLTGQDGSFLAELLLEKGYGVTGLIRGAPERQLGCAEHLREQVALVSGDLLEPASLRAAIDEVRPTELYHLAGPSFVPPSWEQPGETIGTIAGSAAAILEAVRDLDRDIRVFTAASGGMFGDAGVTPQREDTPCRPDNPYAIGKLAAHELVGLLRRHSGLHASSGIVFNHESERRPEWFVTRRITKGAAEIALGMRDELTLGSLDAQRDWTFAGDIVRGAWLMLQQESPDDYVLASGVTHSVAELANLAFGLLGLEAERHLRVDAELIRGPEGTVSAGDATRARERLGWEPTLSFERLVERMVMADLHALEGVNVTP